MSREQQYWYEMEISAPTDARQESGVKYDPVTGKYMMDNVPPEMRAILEQIERDKAAKAGAPSTPGRPSGPPPSPSVGGTPPPPPGPPPDMIARTASLQLLTTVNEAVLATRSNETMDTLLLMSSKDAEIMQLREQLVEAQTALSSTVGGSGHPPPAPETKQAELDLSHEALRAMTERAEAAEAELSEAKRQLTKLQAKLNAVSTLYTEAAQREAVLRIQLEQAGGGDLLRALYPESRQ
jgi:type IV secretory pathway VirB10-like protein